MKALLSLVMLLSAETDCVARATYYEARNQPLEGQLAVAKVVLNRAEDERWPSTACAVIKQKSQFSWVGQDLPPPKGKAWERARMLAITVHIMPDPTNGATHFHADYVSPDWAKRLDKVIKIGDHIFYA